MAAAGSRDIRPRAADEMRPSVLDCCAWRDTLVRPWDTLPSWLRRIRDCLARWEARARDASGAAGGGLKLEALCSSCTRDRERAGSKQQQLRLQAPCLAHSRVVAVMQLENIAVVPDLLQPGTHRRGHTLLCSPGCTRGSPQSSCSV